MITFFLLSFVSPSTLTPKDIFCGEWDVFVGTSSDHEVAIKYSFEFHANKTNGRTISTIWRSDVVSYNSPESKLEPMVAQYEIEFPKNNQDSDDFEGIIFYKGHSINILIKTIENDQLTTKIDLEFLKIYVSLEIINNRTIEISIGSLNNAENEANFVAFRAQPVKLAQILPMFKDHKRSEKSAESVIKKYAEYELPENGSTFSDYARYYLAKGIQLFYRYKIQIYTVIFVIVVQIILFMVIGCIQSLCSKGKNQQKIDTKTEQSKRKKDDDFHSTSEKNGKDDEAGEEEEEENKEEEEETK